MKLHFVEQMDEVLQIALEEKLTELEEETPPVLAAAMPVLPATQPVSRQ
jgi:ATP-dependent Lon protease